MNQRGEDNIKLEQSLIDIAVESWRFSRLFGKVVSKLDAGESGRYINQLRYFQKKVEENLDSNGLKLVNVEGQPYDPGMAASALNLGDFGPDDVLLVEQMLEPIIMGPTGLRKQGTVMLRKVEACNTSALTSARPTVPSARSTGRRFTSTRARSSTTSPRPPSSSTGAETSMSARAPTTALQRTPTTLRCCSSG